MDDTTTENKAAAAFACKNCEDTHRVRVKFTGADGDFTREVACPACGPDLTVTTPESREAQLIEKRLGLITALAVIAAVVAALAYMAATKDKNPFAQAVSEVAE